IASFSSSSADHAFDDSFINSVTSLEEVTKTSFIKEFYVETPLDEDQAPKELREVAKQAEYHEGISLYALREENLRDYAEAIGVNYSDLIGEDKVTGIVVNRAMLTNGKRGESVAVYMNAGESLDLTYNDYYGDK